MNELHKELRHKSSSVVTIVDNCYNPYNDRNVYALSTPGENAWYARLVDQNGMPRAAVRNSRKHIGKAKRIGNAQCALGVIQEVGMDPNSTNLRKLGYSKNDSCHAARHFSKLSDNGTEKCQAETK
jgi:hypothetical protein